MEIRRSNMYSYLCTPQRIGSVRKATPYAVWFYATCSNYIKESGMPTVTPTESDWIKHVNSLRPTGNSPDLKAFHGCLDMSKSRMPNTSFKVMECSEFKKRPGRKSGPMGHQISVAAVAYAVYDRPSGFSHRHLAWAG